MAISHLRSAVLVFATIGLSVSACSMLPTALPTSQQTVSPSDSGAPQVSGTSGVPPLGKSALPITAEFSNNAISVEIQAVRRPFTNPSVSPKAKGTDAYLPQDRSQEWVGVLARTCVPAGAPAPATAHWGTFSAYDDTDARYPGLGWSISLRPLPANDWPSPQYPTWGEVPIGECVRGWLLIPVSKTATLERLAYTTADSHLIAEWKWPKRLN